MSTSLRPALFILVAGILVANPIPAPVSAAAAAEDSNWVKIWDNNMKDWAAYFEKLGLNNIDNTFNASPEGYLNVDIKTDFGKCGWGHLFYAKEKFSYYMVRARYKFTSNSYGPGWAQGWNLQNNGLMLNGPDPKKMSGSFPNSIECQLLGPLRANERTGNLCTPGTFVAYNGNQNYTEHCTGASFPSTWKGTKIPWEAADGFSDITCRCLADSLMQFYIHGEKVMEFSRIRLDNGTPLKEGYLSIQAEGTSAQFKSIEILSLVGCMDKSSPNYRSYFVKNDPSACNKVAIRATLYPLAAAPGLRYSWVPGHLRLESTRPASRIEATLTSVDGRALAAAAGAGSASLACPSGERIVVVRARVDGQTCVRQLMAR